MKAHSYLFIVLLVFIAPTPVIDPMSETEIRSALNTIYFGSPSEGAHAYNQLALETQQGNLAAQLKLSAIMIYAGEGRYWYRKYYNEQEGIRLLRDAVNKGYSPALDALAELGSYYMENKFGNVPNRYIEGKQLILEAANKGSGYGMYLLGNISYADYLPDGRHVHELADALYWYQKAAFAGNSNAKKLLTQIYEGSPQEVSVAEQLIKENRVPSDVLNGSSVGINGIKLGMDFNEIKEVLPLKCKYENSAEDCTPDAWSSVSSRNLRHIGPYDVQAIRFIFADLRLVRIIAVLSASGSYQSILGLLKQEYGHPSHTTNSQCYWNVKDDKITLSTVIVDRGGAGSDRKLLRVDYITLAYAAHLNQIEAEKEREDSFPPLARSAGASPIHVCHGRC